MSIETDIANLISSANTLVGVYRGKEAAIQAKVDTEINRLSTNATTYMQQVGTSLRKTFYVDPVNGNDNNSGTQASPLKTVKKAVELVPYGGGGDIYLQPGDHYIDSNISPNRRSLIIRGADINQAGNTRLLFHQKADGTVPSSGGTFLYSYDGGSGAFLMFRDCSLVADKPMDSLPIYLRTFVSVVNGHVDVQIGEYNPPAGKSSVYVTAPSKLESFRMVHADRGSVNVVALFTSFTYVNKLANGVQNILMTGNTSGAFATCLVFSSTYDGFGTASTDINTIRLGATVLTTAAMKTAGGYDY